MTSRYTMDSKNSDARRYMAQRAELLGAIRLPNDAFKKNAGTEVVSDILFLQKRDHPIDIVPEWVNLDRTEEGHTMNSYFVAHPEMILGDTVEESTAYGMDITVRPIEGMELSDLLKEAVSHIQGTYQAVELPKADKGKEIETIPATPDMHIAGHFLIAIIVFERRFQGIKSGIFISKFLRRELRVECINKFSQALSQDIIASCKNLFCLSKTCCSLLDEFASSGDQCVHSRIPLGRNFLVRTACYIGIVLMQRIPILYANQFKYQKVDGTPPGEELKKTTYSMEELGQRLGLKEATAYELVAKGHFDVVDVLGKRRVTKESFERWYASQTDYRTVEDQELDADIMASTYGLPEMARMLGVHRQTIYYIVANEDFELIKVGRYKRVTKESFEKWYHNQTRYQLAEDRQERS